MVDSTKIESAAAALEKVQLQLAKAELKIAPLREMASELADQLRVAMVEAGIEGISTKVKTFSLRRTQIAVLDDDIAFFEYVAKKKAFDLLRRQPVIAACRARWDEQVQIPGVHAETVVSLGITARKGK